MKLNISLMTLVVTAALFVYGTALACETCGCQDKTEPAKAACENCPNADDCACKDGESQAGCADCPMAGACADCPMAAAEGCSIANGEYRAAENLPDWHIKSPADLKVSMAQIEAFDLAYLPGRYSDDMQAQYDELMNAAGAQGLVNETTHVGAYLPGVQYTEPTEESVINPAIWVVDGTEVEAPVMVETIPGGNYMVVQHWGDYNTVGATYMRTIEWAAKSNITFGDGPSFVLNTPHAADAPMETWLTEIYLPFNHGASATADAGHDDNMG
ncbi:GyrI-like domain-containing protein [bacterium]|nr:GyrI-like domain-containing protein [bacterium]